jgi:hypothetical protein
MNRRRPWSNIGNPPNRPDAAGQSTALSGYRRPVGKSLG